MRAAVAGVQAQLARLLNDGLEIELGHVLGNPPRHPVFDMGFGVDDVDLFELTAGRLDVEEETEDHTDEVEEGEKQIHTPCTLSSENRREHDHGEVANPVGAG